MRVEKSPQTVFTALADGTAVLLNLETLFYYELNKTGAVLWQEIEATNPATVERLVSAVCNRFDVTEDGARPGIVSFVSRLAEFKMVRIV
jgi:hypothetical protein